MKRLFIIFGCLLFFVCTQAHAAENLSVTLSSSRQIVKPKQTFIYSVTVKNNLGTVSEDVDVWLSPDDELDFRSASDNGKKKRGSVLWENVDFAAGETRTFTASVEVDSNATDNAVLYTTAFAGNAYDEVEVRVEDEEDENNDDEHAITVQLFSNKPRVEPNEPFAFIVKLSNHGKRRVSDVDITLRLADNIEFLSASNKGTGSDDEITWKNIDIDGEENRTFTTSVEVTNEAAHGDSLTSIVYAEGSVHEHKIKVWDPEWKREYMELYAFAKNDPVKQGGTLEYIFRVKNLADHDDTLTIDAYIDPKTSFSSASEDGLQYDTNLVRWENLFLKQSETKSLSLKVKVPESIHPNDVIRLGVEAGIDRKEVVTEIEDPPPPGFGSGSASGDDSYFIGFRDGEFVMGDENGSESGSDSSPAIEITMEADKDEVQPGSMITYTVKLKNKSNQDLKDLRITNEHFDEKVEVKDAGGGTVDEGLITWFISSLPKGSTISKKYYVSASHNLKHGDTITTVSKVWSNSMMGSTQEQTNVITQLPQAGWGKFAQALQNSKKYLSTPAHAASAAPPATISSNNRSASPILWTIIIVTGLAIGGILGLKKKY